MKIVRYAQNRPGMRLVEHHRASRGSISRRRKRGQTTRIEMHMDVLSLDFNYLVSRKVE